MTLRQAVLLALLPFAFAACKKKTPPATPGTATPTTQAGDTDARARARADSIAAAERVARERAARAERERLAQVGRVREALSDIIYFEYDSDQLSSEAEEKLRTKVSILRANPALRLRVEGHADERGSTEYNLALGQRRAGTVRDFMGGYGIEPDRIAIISYGEERPMVEGSGEDAWARNRRAEFAVTGGSITSIPAEVP